MEMKSIGAEEFQGGGDNGEVGEEPASSSEAESQSQSTEDDDEFGGEEESEDASEGQSESAEDRKSIGGGKGSAAKSTSTEDDDESGGEWTADRAKGAKSGPVSLEVGGVCAPLPSFPEEQITPSSGEGPAAIGGGTTASRDSARRQAGSHGVFREYAVIFSPAIRLRWRGG